MSIISNIKYLLNIPAIPEAILTRTTPVLIHISDTPDHIYKYIYQIISSVRPEFVVHTGDIVDNTKLESQEHLSDEYSRILSIFIQRLETITNGAVVLTPGNHDYISLMKHHSNSAIIMPEGTTFEFCNKVFEIAHYGNQLSGKADYSLYGHNSTSIEKKGFYNGYNHINFILPEEDKIFTMKYPLGISEMRGINRPLFRGI